MDISIFLAKILGLYLFIMAIFMLVHAQRVNAIVNNISNPPFLFMSGAIILIIGILLIVTHNIWVANCRVLITIIGWLTFIRGIVRLMFPEFAIKIITNFVQNTTVYYITSIIIFFLGIYLSYAGFMS